MHAIARCTRPELVNALFEYFHPQSVPLDAATCPHIMDAGHNQMVCDTCRACATRTALNLPDANKFWPIHAAAWNRNTPFVAHHLRIKGAHATFATANCRDGGNFFHTTCASLSAVDWLESLWESVIVNESDRLIAAQALTIKSRRGRTPLDMAKFQFEHRTEVDGFVKRRTYDWVTRVIALVQ
ncbi:hypothetical protein BCR44DRAFT_387883 [Catenaria anguillulae PL171]|uniref:Uncharacterized protein n=1 Tax=Catenaria anguillulae PL171 TaxID=765915 RepID=A0A1Y2HDF3_9FUNG|nr:hypothetical protein BCR44DRAFT_387883 [Catenaria anguillulae PL171]